MPEEQRRKTSSTMLEREGDWLASFAAGEESCWPDPPPMDEEVWVDPMTRFGPRASAEERQRGILMEVTAAEGMVSVDALARRFSVSAPTIRRDLNELDRRRKIDRVHGGAVRLGVLDQDWLVPAPAHPDARQLHLIARAAADLLPQDPEDAIVLDAGEPARVLAPFLHRRRGPVIVRSAEVALALAQSPGPPVHMLPGVLRGHDRSVSGAGTVSAIDRLSPAAAVVTCDAFDDTDISSAHVEAAEPRTAMIASARTRILLAPSRQFRAHGVARIASIQEIDALVTDDALPPQAIREITRGGTRVHTVPHS